MCHKLPLKSLIIITALFHGAINAESSRFVPLDNSGKPLSTAERQQMQEWPCVLDQTTGLVWEGKTQVPGLHQRDHTFNWFDTDHTRNGGLAGEPGGTACRSDSQQRTACDTQQFVLAVNNEGLCNLRNWRLPRREELRSLVDYQISYPGPATDVQAFPNAVSQFYWSADANASEPLEAWGIGFAFGFDYAYFKTNLVHVRLVSDAMQDSTKK